MTHEQANSVFQKVVQFGGTGFLARLRIRKKLAVLHTLFTLALAAIVLVFLRPAVLRVVGSAESDKSASVLTTVLLQPQFTRRDLRGVDVSHAIAASLGLDASMIRTGNAPQLQIPEVLAARAVDNPGLVVPLVVNGFGAAAAFHRSTIEAPGFFILVSAPIPDVRAELTRLYLTSAAALIGMYMLVALALEVIILPRHVYTPIRRILAADRAVQERRAEDELVPESEIPADELGEIMRSRNAAIMAIRQQEVALTQALDEIERVADDLKRKNFLLEMTRRRLADVDRLASLGIMSAGIAHELNTPLAVIKGLTEKLNRQSESGHPSLETSEAQLMLRVVRRLERLSESLLDFARVRPPANRPSEIKGLIDEAITLVRLDRESQGGEILNLTPEPIECECDSDRIVQVLVNLIRNALDAARSKGPNHDPTVVVKADRSIREDEDWLSITITDNGNGIEPEILARLFEPFVSTRLDSRGTGLGLAVADGIVREHDGLILARNLPQRSGAQFEVMLPIKASSAHE